MGQPYLAGKRLYKRSDRDINYTISFKVIDPESDLALFHQWMNNPRVAQFWDQAWSEKALSEYIHNKLASPLSCHLSATLMKCHLVTSNSIEVQKRASHYPRQAFDRGLHLLVGNELFRGRKFFKA
ncbi:acetyl CoA:N6-hydroxylysine acetyl transferase [Pseudoalteromonas aurantia 208]|uniref:Acetyl CoA:N6-hydroxylysine acetyl transferase n=1 Tax=Pseudoalteromonas aurantia 208 TaxID=1314867 RepID=A0ABR9ECM7_9GAMM|nr:acetyl CoA:N6-hydroxylysine acetyl transferase [Pseudoalteromonas aurantia 208]